MTSTNPIPVLYWRGLEQSIRDCNLVIDFACKTLDVPKAYLLHTQSTNAEIDRLTLYVMFQMLGLKDEHTAKAMETTTNELERLIKFYSSKEHIGGMRSASLVADSILRLSSFPKFEQSLGANVSKSRPPKKLPARGAYHDPAVGVKIEKKRTSK